jgi:putative transcriptional regulator
MDIKTIRKQADLSQAAFAKKYDIPIGTLHHWEAGDRQPPEYVLKLLKRCVEYDSEQDHE